MAKRSGHWSVSIGGERPKQNSRGRTASSRSRVRLTGCCADQTSKGVVLPKGGNAVLGWRTQYQCGSVEGDGNAMSRTHWEGYAVLIQYRVCGPNSAGSWRLLPLLRLGARVFGFG